MRRAKKYTGHADGIIAEEAPTVTITFRIPESLKRVLSQLAKAQDRTMTTLVVRALRGIIPKRGTADYDAMMQAGAAPGWCWDPRRGFVRERPRGVP